MAAPTFDSGDVYTTSLNSYDTTPAVGHQAHNSGDLVIQFLASDEQTATTAPSTGINGETLEFTLVEGNMTAEPSIAVIAWVATTNVASAGTREWGTDGAAWCAKTIVIPSGEFDATTPIDSVSGISGFGSNNNNVPTPAWSGTAAGGRVICGLAVDSDPLSGNATGWTNVSEDDIGNVTLAVVYRDAETTALESIASANFTTTSDTSATVGLVVNGPPGGGSVPLSVFQNANQVIF